MGLKTWKTDPQVTQDMLAKLRAESPPATLDQCRQDPIWRAMLLLSLADEYSTENLEFLDAVDNLRARQPDGQLARQIYDQFVSDSAPTQVNLYSGNHDTLRDAFAANPAPDSVTGPFDAAYIEIYGLVRDDKYGKFITTANGVREELEEEKAVRIDTPGAVQLTADQIDTKVVDQWNERALKDLTQGQATGFYQAGNLVLLVHPQGRQGGQPYLEWAADQDGVVEGTVTMTKKGGALSAGSITAAGVQDKATFEAAVARVSKKKVEY